MNIRRFTANDAQETAAMIARTLRISNVKDYTPEMMEECVLSLSADKLIERAGWLHFYVAEDAGHIIGCGRSAHTGARMTRAAYSLYL